MSVFWIELILGCLYVVVGPVAWGAFGFIMLKGRKRMRLLARPVPTLSDEARPSVTVLVAAKDEAARIERCIESIVRQDYPDFELVVIDDRSTDGTGAIIDDFASRDPRVYALHIPAGELPRGWGGKSHALHRGVRERARGGWLLFVDADVELQPDALRSALAVALRRDFDMISLLPRFVVRGFWEGLLQPLAGAATGAMFAIALTNANSNRTAFANGQFMLVRRDAYEKVGGHEAVRATLSEDTAIARRLKDADFRPRLAWGDEFASVRMYDSLGAICRGWGRNFFVGTRGRPGRILVAVAFVVVCCFSHYAAVAWGAYRNAHPLIAIGGWGWIITGIVHWLLMTLLVGVIYHWSRARWWYALLLPLGLAMLLAIFFRSLLICLTGKVEWRGTSYTRAALRAT